MGTNYVIGSMSKFPDPDSSGGSGGTGQSPDPGGGMPGGGGTPGGGGGTPGGGTPGGGTPGGGTPGGGTPGGGTPGGGIPGGGTPPTAGQTGDGLTILGNTGSGHLIDLELGPAGQGGLPINILADPDGSPSHTIDLNVLDIGTDAPSLIDGTLLSGGGEGGAGDILGNPLDIVDGVLGGTDILGDSDGLSVLGNSGSGHLIDAEIGPAGQGGLPINVLTDSDGPASHTVDLNVLGIGPDTPSLLDTTLLSGIGSSDGLPAVSGVDDLVGNVFDSLEIGGIDGGGADDILAAPTQIVDDVLSTDLLGGVLDHGLLHQCECA